MGTKNKRGLRRIGEKIRLTSSKVQRPLQADLSAYDPARQGDQQRHRTTGPMDATLESEVADIRSVPEQSISILAQRKGYDSPNRWAADLRVLRAQDLMVPGYLAQDTLNLSHQLCLYGGEAMIVSGGGSETPKLKQVDALHATANLDRHRLLAAYYNKERMQSLLKEYRPNIITMHGLGAAKSLAPLRRLQRMRLLAYVDQLFESETKSQFQAVKHLLQADKLVVPSQFMAGHLKEVYQVPAERLAHVPKPVDMISLDRVALDVGAKNHLCDQLRLIKGRPLIMMVEPLNFWQGQHVLIEALARLKDQGLLTHGLFVQTGAPNKDYQKDLEKLARRLGVADQLRFISDEIPLQVAVAFAQVLVSTSLVPEAMLRSVNAAMCLGIPSIVSDHGPAREYLAHHETGWLIPPGNPEALAQALVETQSLNPGQNANLKAWSQAASRPLFQMDALLDQEIDLYLQMLQG